jgi:hypothetical protein
MRGVRFRACPRGLSLTQPASSCPGVEGSGSSGAQIAMSRATTRPRPHARAPAPAPTGSGPVRLSASRGRRSGRPQKVRRGRSAMPLRTQRAREDPARSAPPRAPERERAEAWRASNARGVPHRHDGSRGDPNTHHSRQPRAKRTPRAPRMRQVAQRGRDAGDLERSTRTSSSRPVTPCRVRCSVSSLAGAFDTGERPERT